jgi:hypothetical protein
MAEPYDRIVATFQPKRTDNLKPAAAGYVGWRGEFECLWKITEEDGGPYVGQHAWRVIEENGLAHGGWIPTEDLIDIESRSDTHIGDPK